VYAVHPSSLRSSTPAITTRLATSPVSAADATHFAAAAKAADDTAKASDAAASTATAARAAAASCAAAAAAVHWVPRDAR
jgi:hypothetical protein|tara:strand:- start:201 stop:440 length:240 start_codon:yes stop_codon:yes gene_type:complete